VISPTVYETVIPRDESARLRADTYVSEALDEFSLRLAGNLFRRNYFIDIGCGENTGLERLVCGARATYAGFDCRTDLERQTTLSEAGPVAVCNVRYLPSSRQVDFVHARNVIAHIDKRVRAGVISQLLQRIKRGGRLIVIDEDWSSVRGSDAVVGLRDILLQEAVFFDADYGRNMLERDVNSAIGVGRSEYFMLRREFETSCDYAPLLALRPIIKAGFAMQDGPANQKEQLIAEVDKLFGDIRAEARRKSPPGYRWPTAVGVVVRMMV
jgi:hypothetical protein